MISDEAEYPELNRKLKLVPRDVRIATDPAVCRYLDMLAEALQPIVNEAVAAIAFDVLAYGSARCPIESYVGDAIEADRLRAELKQREALFTRLYDPNHL